MIDLDVLLDTRVGSIMEHNLELGSLLVNDPRYYDRDDDHFERIVTKLDYNETQAWYKNRTVNTLKYAKPTNALLHVTNLVQGMLMELHSTKTITNESGILINLAPYQLSDEEVFGIHQSILSYLGNSIPIRYVNWSKEKNSLAWLDHNNIHTYILYDLYEWSDVQFGHIEDINDCPSHPHINIIGPQLAQDVNVLKKLYEENPELSEDDDLFDIACQHAGLFFKLALIHPALVSYVTIPKQEHKRGD